MPSSFVASRSSSTRLASGDAPSTKNGFSSIFMLFWPTPDVRRPTPSADSRVEPLLARLAVFRQQLPQLLDDLAQLFGLAARDRGLAVADEALRARQVARLRDLRRRVLEVPLPRFRRAVERGRRQPLREPHLP